MKTWRHLPAMLAAAALLTACGGGGGGDSGTGASSAMPAPGGSSSAGSSPDAVAASGTLQASVPVGTYSGALAPSAFDALNRLRQSAGAGLLAQNAALDAAAAAHAKYLTTNIATTGLSHAEDASKAEFYAATVGDRILKAGLMFGFATEVIGGTGASMSGSDCIAGLLNTVYHGAALLSQATRVGIGFGLDAAGVPLCVADLATVSGDAYGQVPASGAFVAYPNAGQTGLLETFYVGYETPRPSASLLPNLTAGTPVIVSVRNADYVNFAAAGTLRPTVTLFVLKDAGGNVVPAVILANSSLAAGTGVSLNADTNLAEGLAVLVPQAPLAKSQAYTVSFAATLKNGGTVLAKRWSFTTGS